MKKFFSNIFLTIIILIFAATSILLTFQDVYYICAPIVKAIGGGSTLLGILFLPFGIFGIIQVIRGAMYIFDHDLKAMDESNANPILMGFYIVSFLLSLVLLVNIIRNWPT